jgi:hypothetical protein
MWLIFIYLDKLINKTNKNKTNKNKNKNDIYSYIMIIKKYNHQ